MAEREQGDKKLTLKQERFVLAYLGEAKGNATEAARIAGYAKPVPQGWENLRKPEIAACVQDHLAAKALTAAEVLAELSDVGRAEWRDFVQVRYNAEGVMVDAKIVLGDKVKALELLGKYHKLFTDKLEHGGELTSIVREYRGVDTEKV